MRIARLPNWRSQLAAEIERLRRANALDCALLVADCIRAMTGVDLAEKYRGRYQSIAEGVDLLRADGFADLCAFVAAHLTEIPLSAARAGDVAAFRADETTVTGGGWALGIVNGERVTVWQGAGLGTLPLTHASRVFRVPG